MNYFNCLFGLLVGMFFSINALGAFNSGAYSLYLFTRNGVIQAHLPHTLKPQSSVERKMVTARPPCKKFNIQQYQYFTKKEVSFRGLS